jgi:hypothetical protein
MEKVLSMEAPKGEGRPKEKNDRILFLVNLVVALVTIAGVLFSTFIYFYDKKNRDIHVVILDSAAFFQNKADFSQTVSINVGSKQVEQLWYIKLRYENFGKSPIKKDEIETSTKINFAGTEVLSVSITEKKPTNLDLEIKSLADSTQLNHGLLNPGDYVVMDVLVSGPRAPPIGCNYRIADIVNCTVKDESSSSREVYIVGLKVNENLALLAASIAFLVAFLLSIGFIILIGGEIVNWIKRFLANRRTESLEDALSLYGEGLSDEIKRAPLNNSQSFSYYYTAGTEIQAFKSSPKEATTVEELLDRARSQSIKASIANRLQQIISSVIRGKGAYHLVVPEVKSPNKLVDFEKETIKLLISQRFPADTGGAIAAFAILILSLNLTFVCAGPLRTLLQKWI